jgi:hypothetical protein
MNPSRQGGHECSVAVRTTLPMSYHPFFLYHTPSDPVGLAGIKSSSCCVIWKKSCALLSSCITPAFVVRCYVNLLCQCGFFVYHDSVHILLVGVSNVVVEGGQYGNALQEP